MFSAAVRLGQVFAICWILTNAHRSILSRLEGKARKRSAYFKGGRITYWFDLLPPQDLLVRNQQHLLVPIKITGQEVSRA